MERMHFLGAKLLPPAAGQGSAREVGSDRWWMALRSRGTLLCVGVKRLLTFVGCAPSQIAFTFSSGFLLDAVRFRMQAVHRDTLHKVIEHWNEQHQSELKKIYLKKMLDDSVSKALSRCRRSKGLWVGVLVVTCNLMLGCRVLCVLDGVSAVIWSEHDQ